MVSVVAHTGRWARSNGCLAAAGGAAVPPAACGPALDAPLDAPWSPDPEAEASEASVLGWEALGGLSDGGLALSGLSDGCLAAPRPPDWLAAPWPPDPEASEASVLGFLAGLPPDVGVFFAGAGRFSPAAADAPGPGPAALALSFAAAPHAVGNSASAANSASSLWCAATRRCASSSSTALRVASSASCGSCLAIKGFPLNIARTVGLERLLSYTMPRQPSGPVLRPAILPGGGA